MGRPISIVRGPSQAWRTLALIVCTGVAMVAGALLVLLVRGRDVEADERPDPALDDERRRYYRLSSFGLRVMQLEVLRLHQIVQLAQSKQVIGGSEAIGGLS